MEVAFSEVSEDPARAWPDAGQRVHPPVRL